MVEELGGIVNGLRRPATGADRALTDGPEAQVTKLERLGGTQNPPPARVAERLMIQSNGRGLSDRRLKPPPE